MSKELTAQHRGYEIRVSREQCLGGWMMTYFTVTRLSDGWIALDSFSSGEDTLKEMVASMKRRIDNEHRDDDPWIERAKDAEFGFEEGCAA
jgi:hypothetical protein